MTRRIIMDSLSLMAVVIAVGLSACDQRNSRDKVAIYSAALDAPDLLRRARGLALDPFLMSDSGTFEASGRLPDEVVEYLKNRGTIQEVCSTEAGREEVPKCQSDSAGVELRLSRPIPIGDTAFAVFVAQGSIKAKRDTFSLFIPFGTAHRCVVARIQHAWLLRGCELHMIT